MLLDPAPSARLEQVDGPEATEANRESVLSDVQEVMSMLSSLGFRTSSGSAGHILAEYHRRQHGDLDENDLLRSQAVKKLEAQRIRRNLDTQALGAVHFHGFGTAERRVISLHNQHLRVTGGRGVRGVNLAPASIEDAEYLRQWLSTWIDRNRPRISKLDDLGEIDL